MRRTPTILFVILVLILVPASLIAWGPEGHEVIAALAEARLTDNAKQGIHALIGDASLASIANWADQVRSQRDETYNWHFVDIPKNVATFSESRDCFLPNNTHQGAATDHHNCVVDRIEMFKQVLGDSSAPQTDRVEALKFLVHFVGDVHQPFHAIGDAAGGNGIHVSAFGSTQCGSRPCNLHAAWDSGLIQHTSLDRDHYVQHLEQLISSSNLTASGSPEDWANESHQLAQAAWLDDGGLIDETYYTNQIHVIDQRLALAGLRLAALLNDALGQIQPPQPVAGSNTTTTTANPADQILPTWNKPEPSKSDFQGPDGTCPWNGDDTDPDTFVRKNRSDVPNDDQLHDVKWSAIHDLPFPKDKPLRANWSAEHLQEIAQFEGVAIRTVGYIVAIKPQNGGKGEGTNCHFKLASETDTHVALVGTFGAPEKDSVVIEFTPRFLSSHPHWNKTTLTKYLNKEIPVRISGWLMLDPDHRNHLNRYRFTLWEIHPITKIEFFENNQWKNIDDN